MPFLVVSRVYSKSFRTLCKCNARRREATRRDAEERPREPALRYYESSRVFLTLSLFLSLTLARPPFGSLEGTLAISIVSRRKQRPGTCWNFFGILSAGLINCLFRFTRFHSRFRGLLSSCSSTSPLGLQDQLARKTNRPRPTSFLFFVFQISSPILLLIFLPTADFRRARVTASCS